MPQAIQIWRDALERHAGHNQNLAAPKEVNCGFALPPADMFITTANKSTAATLFGNWLKLREIFIYRLSCSPDRYSKKEWWVLLTLDQGEEGRSDTRTGKRRLEMKDLLNSILKNSLIRLEALEKAPVIWRGQTVIGSRPPDHLAKEIIWELYELNFRQDLVNLDSQLDESNMARFERQGLLDKCWIRTREYADLVKSQDGFASTDSQKRLEVIRVLHRLMSTWCRLKPPILLSLLPNNMGGHNLRVRLDCIEEELAHYFTSRFLESFCRAPSIPYRLA